MADNEEYKPVEYYRDTDDDSSSRRIRDMPEGKPRFKAEVVPALINFDLVEITKSSTTQIINLRNTGYDDLPIKGVTASGDFSIAHDVPAVLKPDEMVQIFVTFKPVSKGPLTGGVYVDTGDAAGTEFVSLQGEGYLPYGTQAVGRAQFVVENVFLGQVKLGAVGPNQAVSMYNVGDAPLLITGFGITTNFSQTNNNVPSQPIPVGGKITFTLKFHPTKKGLIEGALSVVHNGLGANSLGLVGIGGYLIDTGSGDDDGSTDPSNPGAGSGNSFPSNPYEGQLFYKLPEGIMYIYHNGQWVRVIPAITEEDIQNGLYSNGLRPVEYLDALPTTGNVEGRVVFLTTTKTLYIFVNGEWKTFAEAITPDAPDAVEIFDADPTTDNFEGRTIFNRTLQKLRQYRSGVWLDIAVNTSIGPNSITTEMLVANSITTGKIAAAAIGTDQLKASAITSDKMAANSVTAASVQAGIIATQHLAALSVTSAQIAAGTIRATNIMADTITAGNIQANAISSAKATNSASQWPTVNNRVSIISMLFDCTPATTRILSFSTQLTDESSNGVPNAAVKPVQGTYEVYINGSQVFKFDSFAAAATTCLHSVNFFDNVMSRSGSTLIEVFATALPYQSGERTRVGFRTPTLSVFELKR